jgi:type I restriction enzyme S subunit
VKSDGVSQSNINAQKLADFKFEPPPIEKLFAQTDIIEQAASASMRCAEQVDQSILARAFRGGLG